MGVRLVLPTKSLEVAYYDYIREWEQSQEKIVPFVSRPRDKTFNELLADWEKSRNEETQTDWVNATLYFLVDQDNRIIGASHLRHELNDFLLNYGGHIGYGIRPSERQKGYASKMLQLTLEKAKQKGIHRVLVSCDKINLVSAKTIINNGGVLDDERVAEEDGLVYQRYWIDNN